MKVYVASGFFNEHQLGIVKAIESHLREQNIPFCSPRLESTVGPGMANTEIDKKRTYDQNILGIELADIVVAVLDHSKDSGTIFEIGYAISAGKKVVLLSEVENIATEIGVKLHGVTVHYRDTLEPTDIPDILRNELYTSVLLIGIDFKPSSPHLRFTSSDKLRCTLDDRHFDALAINMSKGKEDPALLTYLGRMIQQGKKVIVYAEDKKSANLMLAYCTPYFCIGEQEFHTVVRSILESDPSFKRRSTEDLVII